MAVVTHPSLSPAEFAAAMERSGWRAPMELIDGEAVVIPPSGGDASLAETEVVHRVRAWQVARGAPGRLLTDVFIRVGSGFFAPDAAWWSAGREPRIEPGALDIVPDLIVEVLSAATRDNDLGHKRRQYIDAGVRELWLIDSSDRSALFADAAGERRLHSDDELESPLLTGFAMRVGELFA